MHFGSPAPFCFPLFFFFFQAEDGIRDHCVTGVQTCALPISRDREDALPGIPGADAAGRRRASGARDRPGCAVGPLGPGPAHRRRGRVSCPMPNPRRYVAALALCLVPAILTSQGTAAAAPRVTWWPRLPLQGSLVRVVVGAPAGGGVTAVSGELAGEPLHFERFADGFGAIGAVPFGAEDSTTARLVMEHADSTSDTVIAALPVARRRVPRERLRVSPEFAEPPDSLTERIRLEQELVQGVRQRRSEERRAGKASI